MHPCVHTWMETFSTGFPLTSRLHLAYSGVTGKKLVIQKLSLFLFVFSVIHEEVDLKNKAKLCYVLL